MPLLSLQLRLFLAFFLFVTTPRQLCSHAAHVSGHGGGRGGPGRFTRIQDVKDGGAGAGGRKRITAVVTSATGLFPDIHTLVVQDESAGILVTLPSPSSQFGFVIGQRIEAKGRLVVFEFGDFEVFEVTADSDITIVGYGAVPAFAAVALDEISLANEFSLIRVQGTVTAVDATGTGFVAALGPGAEAFVSSVLCIDTPSVFRVGRSYAISGWAQIFGTQREVIPRGIADIVAIDDL